MAMLGVDVGLSIGGKMSKHKKLWPADSGTSCHMTFNEDGMFDCREVSSHIKIGNSQTAMATKIGKKRVQVVSQDGTVREFVLEECKLILDFWVNLFSLMKSMRKGWNLTNKGLRFVLTRESQSIVFDQVIKTANGHVTGIELISVLNVAHVNFIGRWDISTRNH
jgi:hypothetical protein